MKLEVDQDGLTFSEVYSGIGIQTPMGLFSIAQRDDGIEVLLTPHGDKTRTVFTAGLALDGKPLLMLHGDIEDNTEATTIYTDVPERVPAYVEGPRAGKGARHIKGTVSKKEFTAAYSTYRRARSEAPLVPWLNGLKHQFVQDVITGGGFSIQELEVLLGHPPRSWIEDKLEDRARLLANEDKLEATSSSLRGQTGGEKLLLLKDKLEGDALIGKHEGNLEDPTTVGEVTGERDKLEAGRVQDDG